MTVNPRVLVVDDDDDVREALELVLASEGVVVETAANGREALARLEAGPRPDMVLLDLRMPELDGWQTIEALRARGALEKLRILICTSAPGDAPPGFTVLPKPVDLEKLLAHVHATQDRRGV